MNKKNPLKIVILGANGQVAQFITSIFCSSGYQDIKFIGIDIQPETKSKIYNKYFSFDLACIEDYSKLKPCLERADIVILCLTEELVVNILPSLIKFLNTTATIIETCSVKTHINNVFMKSSSPVNMVGINLLFRPTLGPKSRDVLVVPYSKNIGIIKELLNKIGVNQYEITPEEHDKMLAIMQVATHLIVILFGSMLTKCSSYRIDLDGPVTPPFRHLLQLVARLVSGNPEIYRNIQNENPFSETIYEILSNELVFLQRILNEPDNFLKLFSDIRSALGESYEKLSDECQYLFTLQKEEMNI